MLPPAFLTSAEAQYILLHPFTFTMCISPRFKCVPKQHIVGLCLLIYSAVHLRFMGEFIPFTFTVMITICVFPSIPFPTVCALSSLFSLPLHNRILTFDHHLPQSYLPSSFLPFVLLVIPSPFPSSIEFLFFTTTSRSLPFLLSAPLPFTPLYPY